MPVTKRELGECYIAGTGVVLGLVLLGQFVLIGGVGIVLGGVGLVPVVALVGTAYWADSIGLGSDQIWTVANYSAIALGAGAVLVLGVDILTRTLFVSSVDTLLLVVSLTTLTALGALLGVILELRRTNQRLSLRNTVLHRVLRHNVRNDMTVLLFLLDELEEDATESEAAKIDHGRQKIHGLVNLTDKVRQVNVTADDSLASKTTVDLVDVIQERVDQLASEYPDVTIETDLPETAPALTTDQFGLVLDNVVQSAVDRSTDSKLYVSVTVLRRTVYLGIEDHNGTLPEADLSALVSQGETDLDHGFGVELWLVYWLVEASDGDITVETEDGTRRIEIQVSRARDGLTSTRLP